MEIYTNVVNGEISQQQWDRMKLFFQSMKNGTAHILISDKKTRSKPQNDYYFAEIVRVSAKELGYEEDEMHKVWKKKFLTQTEVIDGNQACDNHAWETKEYLYEDTTSDNWYEIKMVKRVCTTCARIEKEIVRSTRDILVSEAEEYYEKIRRCCSIEHGIILKEPNQKEWT